MTSSTPRQSHGASAGARGPAAYNPPGRALNRVGVRPSKARGQNFLVQRRVAQQIVNAADIRAQDTIVEIGPGLGILTEQIIAAGPRQVILVELESRLAAMLNARFGADERIKIINRDFLKVTRQDLIGEGLKVIGNLPFSAATAILRHLCDYYRESITRMVLMFQREVGERIRALPGARNYGALSVFSSLYWRIDSHFRVAAGNFHPRPKVDAEVLVMEPRIADPNGADDAGLRATIHAVFSAPRKTIRNSLAGGLGLDTNTVEAALQRINIDPSLRPAMLDCSQLVALARTLRRASSPAHRA